MTPKQLVAKHGDEAARWASAQMELRGRAKKKFGELAEKMLFEREALEQASSFQLARYHASHFRGASEVWDLTVGIGADSLALAAVSTTVTGYEIDPVRAELARFNLSNRNFELLEADGFEALRRSCPDYVWADPDRRSATGRRLTKPEDYSPDPAELAGKLKHSKLAGIKLSPLLPDDYLESLGGSLEFISYQGECLEAIIWLGDQLEKPKRQAVILQPPSEPIRIEATSNLPLQTDQARQYIHDCDPAVVRAHCLAGFDFTQLGDSPGYLTSDNSETNPAYKTYQVLASTNQNSIKKELRRLNATIFEVKQRGVGLDPARLLREVNVKGENPLSLIAFRVGQSIRYLLAERLG